MTDVTLQETRRIWDNEATTFDNEPDHGLRDPLIRDAWASLLTDRLPTTPSKVLDIGCGTGSLSVILASLGHEVMGVDISPNMVAQARAKAVSSGCTIDFRVMDASHPELPGYYTDVIVCRHLLWTLPEPAQVLQRWVKLLKPEGRLILIEGYWHTRVGLHSQEILDALPPSLTSVSVTNLSDQTILWGQELTDERYVIVAHLVT